MPLAQRSHLTPPGAADRFPEALALHQAGRLPEAESLYRAILRREPRRAEAWHLLGVLAGQCGNLPASLELLDQAIELDPRPALYHENRAKALRRLGRTEPAEAAYHAALARAPRQVGLHLGLGTLLLADRRPEEALEPLRRATVLAPGDASAHATYAAALAQLGEATRAEMALRKAARLDPEQPDHWRNLGHVRRQLGKLEAAGEALERAVATAPDDAEARYALGLHRLQLGDLAGGWPLTLGREAAPSGAAWRRTLPQPHWQGESLAGRRLLLWGEQGIGDEVMFARLLPRALADAGSVAVECDPRLVPLYRRSFPGLACLPRGEAEVPAEAFDLQAPLGDLAARWLTGFEAFGDGAAYLEADPSRREALRRRLDDARPLVGLAWRSGNPANGAARTPPLEAWKPLLARRDLRFVALQYGDIGEDLAAFRALGGEVELFDGLDLRDDLEGLAALIAALDGVVTIDNATLHVAGALGVPTLGLLPFGPNWRWFEGHGNRTPWYGSVRLLRQTSPGDWAPPLAEAARRA
ncbi:Flp pilus assembly protein TadD, contains TPR repeats [Tistlia consotensis]|uniref:Flp pilus assembly protein TadD, contains TPR repeats n=1 Tax=Tistlia consotensis USBA 355 TaxID=560819 RepID=A0A1Y6C2R6_9PROT|nr:tetratricopeptide repeat protein [Tistlia consotensis]SMF40754.1 Flp pilus assembly protein TadD, contains TPR repeats [Tistlia consotensis USBA 355]SNR74541.1 Flp pilus assembly protein TadD, contains TPR repeats [Tistlia consotensis]